MSYLRAAPGLYSAEFRAPKQKGGSTQSRLNLTNHHYKEPTHPILEVKITKWGAYPKSQFVRRLQERGDAREEPASSAAVQHAVVKTQCEIGFHAGHEFFLCHIPVRGAMRGAHA